jgi:hypothetical protein
MSPQNVVGDEPSSATKLLHGAFPKRPRNVTQTIMQMLTGFANQPVEGRPVFSPADLSPVLADLAVLGGYLTVLARLTFRNSGLQTP